MSTIQRSTFSNLERAFDVLLDENRRIIRENDLLREELLRHAFGPEKIRLIEDSLASAYRECDSMTVGRTGTAR
jgi:hypothetical protein